MIDLTGAHERQQAISAMRAGKFRDAYNLAASLVRNNKNDLDMISIHGQCALRIGKFSEAAQSLEKFLQRKPDDLPTLIDLGKAYLWDGKESEAKMRFEKALALSPGFPPAIVGMADLCERRNDDAAVEQWLGPIISAGNESPAMALIYTRMLLRAKRFDEVLALTAKHLANANIDNQMRHFLYEKAAKAHEKLGQLDKAFAAFSDSNALRAEPFDAKAFVAHYDQIINVFSAANLAKLPRSKVRSDQPVFIASMPRSGSTLVEQIIHAHPKAFGAGEINDFHDIVSHLPSTLGSMWPYPGCLGDLRQQHADQLARKYLDSLRHYDKRATRIVNKHLDNYQTLGMVELLLPGARVIHVKRDPLDTCFSCFMAQIATNTFHWATDLRTIALAYKQYERIMAHWQSVLKVPMLTVQYEELVDDTETWARKIIEFLGLPWDDKCLRFWEAERTVLTLSYDQVRQPIYKSAVKRHEKYAQFLGPLKEALASEVSHG